MLLERNYPCGDYYDHKIISGNNDANCHRKRPSYACRLFTKFPELCIDCPYIKKIVFIRKR